MEWTYDVARDRLPVLQQQFEWMLQRRNQVFAARVKISPRRAMVGLAAGALVAVGVLFACDHAAHLHHPYLIGALLGLAIGFLLRIAIRKPAAAAVKSRSAAWIAARSDHRIGAGLARVAERTFAKLAAKAPYRIDYRLEDGHLVTSAAAIGPIARLELASVKAIAASDDIVFVFARTWSQTPKRTIYAGPSRDAVIAAFAAAGVPCERIEGPVAGYGDPIPTAATRA